MSSSGPKRALCVVEGVSKRFRLGAWAAGNLRWAIPSVGSMVESAARLLRRQVPPTGANPRGRSDLWALRDVSFQLEPGETVGILGTNGAGKSTLLKLIAGITEPTRGRVMVNGRVSALIELVAGFHPDLTGRENIYLNASIMGMKRQETRSKFDSIVAFAEIEPFLDTPVKRYSSGMQARLGFAVAAHVKPDLLLVDEVLAVGDLSFQQKCLDFMRRLSDQGVTVILISHSMEKITSYCRRGLLLKCGQLYADGPMQQVARAYFDSLQQTGQEDAAALIRSVRITDDRGQLVTDVAMGGDVTIRAQLCCTDPVAPAIGFQLIRGDGLLCAQSVLPLGPINQLHEAGEHEVGIEIRDLPLLPGLYTVDLTLHDRFRGNQVLERRQNAASFLVHGALSVKGVVALDARLVSHLHTTVSGQRLRDHDYAETVRPAVAARSYRSG